MNRWTQRWAGSYTFLSCSFWSKQYSEVLKEVLGKGLDKVLFIHKEGVVSFFIDKEELDCFGNYLAVKTVNDPDEAITMLDLLKKNTNLLVTIMTELEGKEITLKEYQQFYPLFARHLAYHNFMKKTVDYIDQKTLQKVLPRFKDARIYSEKVYSKTEHFFRSLAKAISHKEGYDEKVLTCLTQEELEAYLQSGLLPPEEKLKERFLASAILTNKNKIDILTGQEVEDIEKQLSYQKSHKVKGDSACAGKVQGRCRVITDPFKKYIFNRGDILITGMTRPEFIPFMEKAAAIVTDSGGILCHAAIISRELKIPCIVGTESATRTFQDGDWIEVDADKGVVRRVSDGDNVGSGDTVRDKGKEK